MPPLVIVDPALGRTGAHNQGFIEMLVQQGIEPGRLGIWCNGAMAGDVRDHLAAGGVVVKPMFSVDFYQLAAKGGGVADHWDWIYRLTNEYLATLRQVLDRWPGESIRLLYHTMSWEHATALSLAIRLFGGEGGRLHHLVLLMYSPGIDQEGRTFDPDKRLNFRLAFVALDELPNVDLYASCSEYAVAYGTLLKRAEPLPLHPCFLGDWRDRPDHSQHEAAKRILLYVGEIKQEKGFLALPKVTMRLLETTPDDHRLVIQFVGVRNEAGRHVLQQLSELAASHERIELHHGFWPEEQLLRNLSTCSIFRMDYDAAAYAHKTSGLLWLAAWYRLPVVVPENTWLEREARRLGMAVVPAGKTPLVKHAKVNSRAFDTDYFRAVFTPFRDWLESIPERLGTDPVAAGTTINGARPAAPSVADIAAQVQVAVSTRPTPRSGPQTSGADIVLFWKQNDTTLYGRRCDMVARYLASRDDVRKVVVVDAPIGETELARLAGNREFIRQDRWIHARTLEKLAGRHDSAKLHHAVFVYPSGEFPGNENDDPGARFLERYAGFLEDEFASQQIDASNAVFWVYPRNLAMPYLAEHFSPARMVVDVVDDHRAWPGVAEEEKRCLTDHYCELLAMADLALANCEPVQQAMREFCADIALVANGCDSDPPPVSHAVDERLGRFLAYPGKTIGYVGNLEAKIDGELLARVAERFSDCKIVLIGSTHANPDILALQRYPNIHMPGVVPYDQLGRWLVKFDVGLIPHLDMDLTRYMNPLKAYVYLSRNVPVVATAVPNVASADGLIRVAGSHERFLDEVASVLESGRPPLQAFSDYVKANDWASRLSATVDALDLRGIGPQVHSIPRAEPIPPGASA